MDTEKAQHLIIDHLEDDRGMLGEIVEVAE